MNPVTHDDCIALWHRASTSEIGIEIKTDDKRSLMNQLYEARKVSGGFENVCIVQPGPYPDALWLTRKTVELEA